MESTAFEAIQTAFGTGIGVIKDNVVSLVVVALPVALIVVGLFLAIKLGMKFFKGVAK